MERIKKETMNKTTLILRSKLSQAGQTMTPEQTRCAELAMLDYMALGVATYRENESKALTKEATGLFSSIIKGELKLWIRNWYFKKAKKEAILRSQMENRKFYVIRKTDIAYQLLSTADVEQGKKLKVLGKHVDAKKLTETADFVAYPKKVLK